MSVQVAVVDAFTAEPFAGNPAGVCVLERAAPEAWMQRVAAEMALSETAFLHREGAGADASWRLRWFTPVKEAALCGHATLASAHVLWERGLLDPAEPVRFLTLSGPLGATRQGAWIELDFPALPAREEPAPAALLQGLGAPPRAVATGGENWLAAYGTQEEVQALAPDFRALATLDPRGVIATAPAARPGFDYVCRYFAPSYGIDEDPVTGSIQSTLGPWWQERLKKDVLMASQVSPRGGVLRVAPRGARVGIAGQAVTMLRSELLHGP